MLQVSCRDLRKEMLRPSDWWASAQWSQINMPWLTEACLTSGLPQSTHEVFEGSWNMREKTSSAVAWETILDYYYFLM